MAAAKATTVVEHHVETYRAHKLLFSLGIDVSGSMAGAGMKAALAALTDLHAVLVDSDQYALCTFQDDVRVVHPACPKSASSLEADKIAIQEHLGGRTALWAGIAHTLDLAKDAYVAEMAANRKRTKDGKRTTDAVTEVIVITDGCDTASPNAAALFARLKEQLRTPGIANFNFVVIAVGNETDPVTLLELQTAAPHCHLVQCETKTLQATLRAAVERVVLKRIVTSTSADKSEVSQVTTEIDCHARDLARLQKSPLLALTAAAEPARKEKKNLPGAPQPAAAAAAAAAASGRPCYKFGTPEGCPFGSRCRFSHGSSSGSQTHQAAHRASKNAGACRFGTRAACSWGARCRFQHVDG